MYMPVFKLFMNILGCLYPVLFHYRWCTFPYEEMKFCG